MLLAQAASAIGLATGGVFSKAQLMGLWMAQGGPARASDVASAVALAESGGRANAVNHNTDGSTDRGLWQINSVHGRLSTFDPAGNARAADIISSDGTNWNPWVAYTTGRYSRFLGAGSAGVGATGSVSAGTGGGLGGILGDIISSGAGVLLNKLPGVDKIPEWLKGTGKYILEQVTGWIKDKVSSLIDSSGGGSGGGYTPGSIPADSPAHDKFMAMQRTGEAIAARHYPYSYGGGHNGSFSPSSDIRGTGAFGYDCSGLVSAILHSAGLLSSPLATDGLKSWGLPGAGKAVTVGVRGGSGMSGHTMMQIGSRFIESGSGHGAAWVGGWAPPGFPIKRHPPGLAQGGIYAGMPKDVKMALGDPAIVGWGLAQGGIFPPYAGEFHTGGIVGGPVGQAAMATVLGGEAIVPDGDRLIGALRENSEELRQLRKAGISGVMATIADYTLERGGQESHRRRMTAGNPSVTALLG